MALAALSTALPVMFASLVVSVATEFVCWLLVYRTSSYKRVRDELDRHAKRFESFKQQSSPSPAADSSKGGGGSSSSRPGAGNKERKEKRLEDNVKTSVAHFNASKMKANMLTGVGNLLVVQQVMACFAGQAGVCVRVCVSMGCCCWWSWCSVLLAPVCWVGSNHLVALWGRQRNAEGCRHLQGLGLTCAPRCCCLCVPPPLHSSCAVARLPFEPPGFLASSFTHRGLPGSDMSECSALFLYILTSMFLRLNISMACGWSPSRAAERLMRAQQQLAPADKYK
jgi:hypothetical protein